MALVRFVSNLSQINALICAVLRLFALNCAPPNLQICGGRFPSFLAAGKSGNLDGLPRHVVVHLVVVRHESQAGVAALVLGNPELPALTAPTGQVLVVFVLARWRERVTPIVAEVLANLMGTSAQHRRRVVRELAVARLRHR